MSKNISTCCNYSFTSLKNVSTENARCAPVQAIIVTDKMVRHYKDTIATCLISLAQHG